MSIFLGQVKMSPGQVFFIRFVLYLPEWASGDKNLYSTLASCTICVDIRKMNVVKRNVLYKLHIKAQR